jgi:uncharacterized membrane protein
MAHVEDKCIIKVPIECTFDFVVSPANRPQWMDKVLEVKDISPGSVGVGTSWNEKQKVAGRIIEFVAKITELDRPHKYAMNMVIPGGEGILVTIFEPENDGTLMTRTLDYTFPGAFFGRLAEKLLFDRFVKKSIRDTSATLKIVLESRQNS